MQIFHFGPAKLAFIVLLWSASISAQQLSALDIDQQFRLVPDITYLKASNFESKLDVIGPEPGQAARPVLLYIHGGGWVGGNKNSRFLQI